MKLPCENAIWYILPRVRADIAKELVKGGMSQKDAAKKLGITPAAVSQYLNKKRGGQQRSISPDYQGMIAQAIEEIKDSDDENAISKVLCGCCVKSRT